MSSRVSKLNDKQAKHARDLIKKSAAKMVREASAIHYTQGGSRWQGINAKLTITKNQRITYGDCSSTSAWLLWDAIARSYGRPDLTGCHWAYGYTGTQYKAGKRVVHDKNLKIGDLIFYGDQGGGVPEHVAVYIGGGKVFSHGSEGGPYILNIDYRGDRRRDCMRRFI